MNDETFELFRLQEFITRREGMIAENQQRIHRGESLAYTEDSFLILVSEMRDFANAR
jgi:hypothetical protein